MKVPRNRIRAKRRGCVLPFGKNAPSILASFGLARYDCVAANEALRFSCVASFEATHFCFKGGEMRMKKWIALLLALVMCLSLCACGSSKKCVICGKRDGLRQITAQAGNGKWDDSWYCIEHYADAWQYYYGND